MQLPDGFYNPVMRVQDGVASWQYFPAVTLPAAPPLPTGPPNSSGGYVGPNFYVFGQYNVAASDVPGVVSRGIVNVVFYQSDDFNGGTPSAGAAWRLACKQAGLKMVLIPGHRKSSPGDYSSTLLGDLDDPDVLWLTLNDEPEQGADPLPLADAKTIVAGWKSAASSAGKNMKPITLNLTAYDKLFPKPFSPTDSRAWMDWADVGVWSTDAYFLQLNRPRMFGLLSNGGFEDAFTSTIEGKVAYRFITGPVKTGNVWSPTGTPAGLTLPTAAAGKPYLSYIPGCRIGANDNQGHPMPPMEGWELSTLCWSNVIFGGVGIIQFNTYIGPSTLITDYQSSDQSLVPTLQEFKRRIGILQARGVLMAPGGGRHPWITRPSAPALTNPDQTAGGPADTGASWAPPSGNQMPGGFEGVELVGSNGGHVRVVQNITGESRGLTDAAWGITSMQFPRGECRAFDVIGGVMQAANIFA